MSHQAYSMEKPGNPKRALLVSLLLLLGALVLAQSLVGRNSGGELGDRVTPEGWGLSFRPPARFVSESPKAGSEILHFDGSTDEGLEVLLTVAKLPSGTDPRESGLEILPGYAKGVAQIGGHPATQWTDAQGRLDIRAIRLTEEHDLFLKIEVTAGLIDSALARTFDRVCESVRYRGL